MPRSPELSSTAVPSDEPPSAELPSAESHAVELSGVELSAAEISSDKSVLAVVVCHNGESWLPAMLSALCENTVKPQRVLAVDTGSTDHTGQLLAEAVSTGMVSEVLTLPANTGFSAAVHAALARAETDTNTDTNTETDSVGGFTWLWLLHDDSAPEPDCLKFLLSAVENDPLVGVVGPLAVDWENPRLISEAGFSIDASGNRHAAMDKSGSVAWWAEPTGRPAQPHRVLAVSSAGALIRLSLWRELSGFDEEFPLLAEDSDFGWRVNAMGKKVLCVPLARLKHLHAVAVGLRADSVFSRPVFASARMYGVRIFLVNCAVLPFLLGLVRIPVWCLVRGLGFAVLQRWPKAQAEFGAIRFLLTGQAKLLAGRAWRREQGLPGGLPKGAARELLVTRRTRLALAISTLRAKVGRRRTNSKTEQPLTAGSSDLPPSSVLVGQSEEPSHVGPEALPAGIIGVSGIRAAGLRRPSAHSLFPEVPPAVSSEDISEGEKSDQPSEPQVGFLARVKKKLFVPPVVLLVSLTVLALVINRNRLGFDLAGGQLLPVGGLGELWSSYLASWHSVGGGTGGAASPVLPVLGIAGAIFLPLGGPPALVSVLLIGVIPLSAATAYFATRRVRVSSWLRAGFAAAYGLAPVVTASVTQGRLDGVVAHILAPLVAAGIARILLRSDKRWVHTAMLCAAGVALLGAFSPVGQLLAVTMVIVGFVVVPSPGGLVRGIISVAIVVLVPLALLLPWPIVLFSHPSVLLHGLGLSADAVSVVHLVGLDPGGAGGWPIGIVVVVIALAALILRPSFRVWVGFAVAMAGVGAIVLVRLLPLAPLQGESAEAGFTGVPITVLTLGLLWMILAACPDQDCPVQLSAAFWAKVIPTGMAVVVLVLALGAVLASSAGPLRVNGGDRLADALAKELASTGRSVLVLGSDPELSRQRAGQLPQYGDEQVPLSSSSPARLAGWQRALSSGTPEEVRQALSAATAAGVLFIVLPQEVDAARLNLFAPGLSQPDLSTRDGRRVLRLTSPAGPVVLIPPESARQAVRSDSPDGFLGVTPVQAALPDVRVRVSEGPVGRLLVLAAEQEAGWRATVNGQPVPIVPAWGHQIAVAVPDTQAEVFVEHSSATRSILLLAQVAAVLFTLLVAIPGRRKSPTKSEVTS